MLYEWDDEKNRTNIRKHGLSLKAGVSVFDDLYRIEMHDGRHDYGEDRFSTIGLDKDADVLVVVYTERIGNIIRLISVRRATGKEAQLYYRYRSNR